MKANKLAELVEKWRKDANDWQAEADRVQGELERGETVTKFLDCTPRPDDRLTCADELEAALAESAPGLAEVAEKLYRVGCAVAYVDTEGNPELEEALIKDFQEACDSYRRVRDGLPLADLRPAEPTLTGTTQAYGGQAFTSEPTMGKGDYSCVTCGMGMMEPCEHWKAILDQEPTKGKPDER